MIEGQTTDAALAVLTHRPLAANCCKNGRINKGTRRFETVVWVSQEVKKRIFFHEDFACGYAK
jgi:hypothetical protein